MSILFPPWHRAYLALYEQVLFRLAGRIAGWFTNATERSAYQAAAANFRIPYWDWAMAPPEGESAFLPEFETPGIQVRFPNMDRNEASTLRGGR
ncbi:Tyrosinase [Colletotrichum orbiculare MAFF 240422]|uniref:Tyrosinase n=1 Tax=Colletotrichum orbiculare (strain 104-T / ATCC 96160 / CBS 514.97 / LARS 414 / MAFF 240422) TaxID=1213857 RepID=A0A484FZG9_COLOR|nr:Tyrosinase [Colletotrichum orbiculare MAFF 240422]